MKKFNRSHKRAQCRNDRESALTNKHKPFTIMCSTLDHCTKTVLKQHIKYIIQRYTKRMFKQQQNIPQHGRPKWIAFTMYLLSLANIEILTRQQKVYMRRKKSKTKMIVNMVASDVVRKTKPDKRVQ